MLYLYGKSGTTYLYIHLNNDLTEKSEDKGGCKLGVAYAVEDGAKVTAGEQIALPGRLGRRGREPPPPLRGAPERRRRRQSVPVPQRGRAPPVPRPDRDVVLARACAASRSRPAPGRSSFAATSVRWWPGGQWTPVVGERPVTLAVAKDAVVDTALVAALQSPERRALQARTAAARRDRVHGATKVTAEALRGEPGALRGYPGHPPRGRPSRPTLPIRSTRPTTPPRSTRRIRRPTARRRRRSSFRVDAAA